MIATLFSYPLRMKIGAISLAVSSSPHTQFTASEGILILAELAKGRRWNVNLEMNSAEMRIWSSDLPVDDPERRAADYRALLLTSE